VAPPTFLILESPLTGGSTEPNGGLLTHEKKELMDTSLPQKNINDVDSVTIGF